MKTLKHDKSCERLDKLNYHDEGVQNDLGFSNFVPSNNVDLVVQVRHQFHASGGIVVVIRIVLAPKSSI